MNIEELEEALTPPRTTVPRRNEWLGLAGIINLQIDTSPGLEPHWGDTYRRREYQQVPTALETNRQTGRTTRIIMGALIEMSEGREIFFIAPTRAIGDYMCRRALDMADWLRIPITYIGHGTRENEALRRGPSIRVYYDHTWNER